MKTSALALSLAFIGSALALHPGDFECAEYIKYKTWYQGAFQPACGPLIDNCQQNTISVTTDIWSVKSCVAAATCQGTVPLFALEQCRQDGFPNATDVQSLNYNIYASIVGDCAWQEGGCPITQQNYIDFIYGTLSEIGTSTWPDASNVIQWWGYITQWAATGDTVPYLNFNDWLHYSNSQ